MFWTGFTGTNQVGGAFAKLWKEQLERLEAMTKEMDRLEDQGVTRVREMMGESAKLAEESLAYGHKLSAEWRKVSLEAAKKTAELFGAA